MCGLILFNSEELNKTSIVYYFNPTKVWTKLWKNNINLHFYRIFTNEVSFFSMLRKILLYISLTIHFVTCEMTLMLFYFITRALPSNLVFRCISILWLCCQATFSTQCTHLATWRCSITTVKTGHTTIGSGTQSDLLMMGIKMPETCWNNIDYQ